MKEQDGYLSWGEGCGCKGMDPEEGVMEMDGDGDGDGERILTNGFRCTVRR